VLGTGHRLFDRAVPTRLELVDSATTATGVLIATYTPMRAEPGVSTRGL
jgi:hypothetical protein